MRKSLMCVLLALVFAAAAQAAEQKATLLAVSKGAMPNDTTDDPKLALEEKPELGGPALKVTFPKGSAFGETKVKIADWSGYRALAFDALNPGNEILPLALCIRHKGTKGFPTRADVSFMLKPGKNNFEVALADLANVDGSRPDFSLVKQWYITCDKEGPTAYFGDFWLLGEAKAAPAAAPATAPATAPGPVAPAPAARSRSGPGQPVRITGKIGDTQVDLTITGLTVIMGQGGSGLALQPAAQASSATPAVPAPAAGAKATLLDISKGSMPGDTNGEIKVGLEESKELGGIALKVTFGKDASFGDTHPKIADWRPYSNLTFTAINSSQNPVPLSVVIRHKGTRPGMATRVDRDLMLAPGKNDVAVPIAGLANNDGSAADLSQIKHWYVSSNSEATILFGDFCLEGPK